LDAGERERALSLMEMGRHAMLMFTSCGWFFDDLSGIETVQCMQYAARVAELMEGIGGHAIEPPFVDRIAEARSNIADEGDGRRVWSRRVVPARIDPEKVCAHVAVNALVDPNSATLRVAARPGEAGAFPDRGKSIDVYGYHVEFVDR